MKSIALLVSVILLTIESGNKTDSYFKFDTAEHFQTDYKKFEKDGESIYSKVGKNQREKDLLNILRSQKVSFQDTVAIKKLEELGFDKIKLSNDKVDQLRKLFTSEKLTVDETVFCDPIYNDILVFRSKEKITGFAKICFSCGKMITVTEDLIERLSAPNENFLEIKKVLKQ